MTRPIDRATSGVSLAWTSAVLSLFGVYSLWLGQDTNWDLFNYHLYNPFALFEKPIGRDWAPAGLQTFFNPLIDVPWYLASSRFAAPVVGFAFGVLHGLTFVLLHAIARQLLPGAAGRRRIAFLLAASGCLTSNFLSEFASTMGDDTTALLVLTAVLLLVRGASRSQATLLESPRVLVAAGLITGLAMGLKLTNVVFGLALCGALLLQHGPLATRLRGTLVFGACCAAGLLSTGGFWLARMWTAFGNPLFPQFGSLFPTALAPAGAAIDTIWLPRDGFEFVAWPFLMALDPTRVGQMATPQVVWALVYVVVLCTLVGAALRRSRRQPLSHATAAQRLVIWFVVLGFVLWTAMFSIARYLVAIEVLAPLVVFLLLSDWLPARAAKWSAGVALGATALIVCASGAQTYGHELWAERPFSARIPHIARPDTATVVTFAGEPTGWLATMIPSGVSVVMLDNTFGNRVAYDARAAATIAARGGDVHAIVAQYGRRGWVRMEKVRLMLATFGLLEHETSCTFLESAFERFPMRSTFRPWDGRACDVVPSLGPEQSFAVDNRRFVLIARDVLARMDLVLDVAGCRPLEARVGQRSLPYLWCSVQRR